MDPKPKNFQDKEDSNFKSPRNWRKDSSKRQRKRDFSKEVVNQQDPYWYAKDDQAIKGFASLPFVETIGYPITDAEFAGSPIITTVSFTPTIPGAIGYANYATRAADAFYQSIAQGFSANFDFEAPDLLMLALAAADLQAYMLEGARAFGCLNYFTVSNAGWPKTIVSALGFDYNDLAEHRMEFYTQYNLRVDQINKILAVPKDFFIASRWSHLSKSIFTENLPADMATLFAYKHARVLVYDGTISSTGTALRWGLVPFNGMTVSQFFFYIDELINTLIGDDQRQMFAAIRRVYSEGELTQLAALPPTFCIEIDHNAVQSLQLHNATILEDAPRGNTDSSSTNNIACYQTSNGNIATNYKISFNLEDASGNVRRVRTPNSHLISMAGVKVDPGVTLDITANMLGFSAPDSDDESQTVFPRAEVLHDLTVWDFNRAAGYRATHIPQYFPGSEGDVARSLERIMRMDRAPLLYRVEADGDGNLFKETKVYGELDQYTVVSDGYLRDLHAKCAYNLLGLPINDKSVTK